MVELAVPGWADEHTGLRVGVLAGLHVGAPRQGEAMLRRIASTLAELGAPLGRYAVLGNHDRWFDAERVRRALPVVPSRFGQRYAAGHVIEGGRHLYVAAGTGTSILPVRLGVPPEVVVLTLEPTARQE